MTNLGETVPAKPPQPSPEHALSPTEVTESRLDSRRVAGAALIVMLFFVLSRVAGLAREVVIAAQFGASAELDAYLAAFRIPDILFQLVAGGALGSAFIPTFAQYWGRKDRAGAWLLFSRVVNLVTLALIGLAVCTALLAQPLVQQLIAPGFTPAQQQLTIHLMRWMLVSTIIFGASGLIMGALNGVHHFLLPAAAPVCYNLAIILGAWLLAPKLGIDGLVIGVVTGALLHCLVQLPGLWRSGAHYTWAFSLGDPGVREVLRLMGPRVLGLFFVQMQFLVNTILASGLAPGSLSALNYAWLLMLLPQGVFAQSIATAIFPTFAIQVAAGQSAAMRQTFGQIVRVVIFLTLPAAMLLFVLCVPLISAFLERGEFTAQNTHLVAQALQFYALGLVAHAVVEITVRAFYALHDTWTPVIVGVAAMGLNILFSFAWVGWLGHGGLALANSVATSLEMVALFWLLQRRFGGMEWARFWLSLGRNGIATLLAGAIVSLWLQWLPQFVGMDGLINRAWLVTVSSGMLAVVVYTATCLLLRCEEVVILVALFQRRR